jgi:predicted cupin superfamily sugar epimerase
VRAENLSAVEIISALGLEPLPIEGGFYRQTHHDSVSSAIYFLITPDEFSAMHRLSGPELWHFYAGDPVSMLLLSPDGEVDEPVLGIDLLFGQRPQVMVGAGVYMGASTTGTWSLLGTTMAPPFTAIGLEFPSAAALIAGWPTARSRITDLTR